MARVRVRVFGVNEQTGCYGGVRLARCCWRCVKRLAAVGVRARPSTLKLVRTCCWQSARRATVDARKKTAGYGTWRKLPWAAGAVVHSCQRPQRWVTGAVTYQHAPRAPWPIPVNVHKDGSRAP